MAARPAIVPSPDCADGESAGATDDILIGRAARGDRAAWRLIVTRHLAGVTSTAWYLLADRAEAEDVAQETFLRFSRKIDAWQPDGAPLRAWLSRVAVNLCIDRKRTPRARLEVVDSDALQSMAVPDQSAAIDRRRIVHAALRQLPERQRIALVLVYFQGYSDREAAQVLAVGVEAIESLLARGRRSLREMLKFQVDDLLGGSP